MTCLFCLGPPLLLLQQSKDHNKDNIQQFTLSLLLSTLPPFFPHSFSSPLSLPTHFFLSPLTPFSPIFPHNHHYLPTHSFSPNSLPHTLHSFPHTSFSPHFTPFSPIILHYLLSLPTHFLLSPFFPHSLPTHYFLYQLNPFSLLSFLTLPPSLCSFLTDSFLSSLSLFSLILSPTQPTLSLLYSFLPHPLLRPQFKVFSTTLIAYNYFNFIITSTVERLWGLQTCKL